MQTLERSQQDHGLPIIAVKASAVVLDEEHGFTTTHNAKHSPANRAGNDEPTIQFTLDGIFRWVILPLTLLVQFQFCMSRQDPDSNSDVDGSTVLMVAVCYVITMYLYKQTCFEHSIAISAVKNLPEVLMNCILLFLLCSRQVEQALLGLAVCKIALNITVMASCVWLVYASYVAGKKKKMVKSKSEEKNEDD